MMETKEGIHKIVEVYMVAEDNAKEAMPEGGGYPKLLFFHVRKREVGKITTYYHKKNFQCPPNHTQ